MTGKLAGGGRPDPEGHDRSGDGRRNIRRQGGNDGPGPVTHMNHSPRGNYRVLCLLHHPDDSRVQFRWIPRVLRKPVPGHLQYNPKGDSERRLRDSGFGRHRYRGIRNNEVDDGNRELLQGQVSGAPEGKVPEPRTGAGTPGGVGERAPGDGKPVAGVEPAEPRRPREGGRVQRATTGRGVTRSMTLRLLPKVRLTGPKL